MASGRFDIVVADATDAAGEAVRSALAKHMVARFPTLNVDEAAFAMTPGLPGEPMAFTLGADVHGVIYPPEKGFWVEITSAAGETSGIGMLFADVPVTYTPSLIHANLPASDTTFSFNQRSKNRAELSSENPKMNLVIHQPTNPTMTSHIVVAMPNAKNITVQTKSRVEPVKHEVVEALCRHMSTMFGSKTLNALFVNIGTLNISGGGGIGATKDEGPKRTTDSNFLMPLKTMKVLDDIVALTEHDLYTYDATRGMWSPGTLNDAACILRREARKGGRLDGALSEVDAAYLQSCDGPLKVLKSIVAELKIPRFQSKLDQVPEGCLPFDNGLLDARTGILRPFEREDYISTTIGYDYTEPTPEDLAFITEFYRQIFPYSEEREYFLRVNAHALFSLEQLKMILVLSDVRDGSNGKTTVMRAIEAVFGNYHAHAERDFLYESSSNNANGAAANFLAYSGKKLAFFDEPSADEGYKRLDMRRLKDLSSGDAHIRGRYLMSNDVLEVPWRALLAIACNESNFPRFDPTDVPGIKRLKVLKMRSLFITAEEAEKRKKGPGEGDGDEEEDEDEDDANVFVMVTDGFKHKLNETCKMAHMHLLIGAYQRILADGGIGPEPACIAEMCNKLAEASDPRFEKAQEYLDAMVDFQPVRGPEFAGKKLYAWVSEKDFMNAFWTWYTRELEFRKTQDRKTDTKKQWKAVVHTIMKGRGVPVKKLFPIVAGKSGEVMGYNKVSLRPLEVFAE